MSEREPTPEQLIAAYADDPASLGADERAAVEARVARDPAAAAELAGARSALEALRALDVLRGARPVGEPDWDRLSADIGRAIDAVPRRPRWRPVAIGAVALAAAAAILIWWQGHTPRHDGVARVTIPDAGAPTMTPAPPSPDETEAAQVAVVSEDLPDDMGGLGGMVALDDSVLDELGGDEAAPADDVPSAGDPDDKLMPDSGWIDDMSDAEVERALKLLERGKGS